ncbi:MAG: NADH-quinone oxidoreductase subunit N [Opitutales bacterium]|nr:NADH-quinone oxidoreductase subunit N [Opitutales bacterium]
MSDNEVSILIAFLPEWLLLLGALTLFTLTLSNLPLRIAHRVSIATAAAVALASVFSFGVETVLFDGAYQVDAYSQWLKLVFALGYLACVLIADQLKDIRGDVRPEYYFLLSTSILGFVLLASSIDLITLVVALELSSFPLFILIAMRREANGQRSQMESAVKYMMFGIGATGVMLFGMAYLYGLTGTTSLPLLIENLQPVLHRPLAIAGLAMTMAAFFYKLAVFPFHFWTPDVYQGASNGTTAILASIPKVAAVLVLVRFASAAEPGAPVLALVLAVLAIGSMCYGNLLALVQSDFKRLLGFSAIAHAGYTLLGLVALSDRGFTAALYYTTGYLFMILACFVVITRVSRDGANLPISALAGLYRRSPLLAWTLLVAVFSLAGIPPMVGFMGKFSLLSAALEQGYLWLVLIAVVNTVIAVYYYLNVIRCAFFAEPEADTADSVIILDWPIRVLCVALIAVIIGLGILPGSFLEMVSASLGF